MFKNKPLMWSGLSLLIVSLIVLGNFANDYWKYTVSQQYNHQFVQLSADIFWEKDIYWGIGGAVAFVAAIVLLIRARKGPEAATHDSDILDR